MVEQQPSKLMMGVRFPSPAPTKSMACERRSSQRISWEDHGKTAEVGLRLGLPGTDRSQLSSVAKEAKASIDAVADRGYVNSEEILACEEAGITVGITSETIHPDGAPDARGYKRERFYDAWERYLSGNPLSEVSKCPNADGTGTSGDF
jgi:hypothetical protein